MEDFNFSAVILSFIVGAFLFGIIVAGQADDQTRRGIACMESTHDAVACRVITGTEHATELKK
jgi:hypothetical protein